MLHENLGLPHEINLQVKNKLFDIFSRKEGNVLFNDALNTFYFTVIWRWNIFSICHYCYMQLY